MILYLNNNNHSIYSVAILGITKASHFQYINNKPPYVYFYIGGKRSNMRVKCYPESYFRFCVFEGTNHTHSFIDHDRLNYWIKSQT